MTLPTIEAQMARRGHSDKEGAFSLHPSSALDRWGAPISNKRDFCTTRARAHAETIFKTYTGRRGGSVRKTYRAKDSKMSSIANLVAELKLKLGDRARDELDRLVSSPEGEALLRRDEAKIIAERKLLTKRLVEVGPKFAKAQAEAGVRSDAAAKTLADAESALRVARDEYAAACAQSIAAQTGEADERLELERELRDGADARLETFALHCEDLCGMARHVLVATPVAKRNWVSGERWTEVVTNAVEVQACRDALTTAASTARGMRLQALESMAVTEWIQQALSSLEPLLRPFRLDLLSLDESGNLTRDKSVPRRVLINTAIRSNGGTTDVSDDLPVHDTAPNRRRAERALGLLA